MAKITVMDLIGKRIDRTKEIPEDYYKVKIVYIKERPSNFEGTCVNIEFEILTGPYQGFGLSLYTTSVHANGEVGSKLAALILATLPVNETAESINTSDLIDKECVVEVKHYRTSDFSKHVYPYYIARSYPIKKPSSDESKVAEINN